ncbi:hypothetical protein ASE63_01185 [Bosea sp. Root381]|nr:hypothetical protein ASE63_01185 [Bosea sp. Root381]
MHHPEFCQWTLKESFRLRLRRSASLSRSALGCGPLALAKGYPRGDTGHGGKPVPGRAPQRIETIIVRAKDLDESHGEP